MATYAGDIITRFGADLSGLSRGFSQAQSMGSSFSSQMQRHTQTASAGFGGMAKSVLAAGAGLGGWIYAAKSVAEGAIGLGQALLGSSADMEQTRIAFTGLMGGAKQADAMLRQLQDFAAKTPFEFPELAKDTQMLIGMGVASKDVIPWMTAIGDAAAGIGAGAEGANSITRALGQMQAKTKVSGEEMMQLTEAGIPAWKILAQSMGLTVAQVQDLSQKGQLGQDAINKLVTGMEKMYGGQMKNQATTMNGLLSTLKDNAGMALRAFVGPLFEAAKNGLKTLTDFLGSPTFQNFATGAAKLLADAMQRIGQFIGPVVAGIGSLFSQVSSGKGAFAEFLPILQQVVGVYFQNFLSLGQQIAAFVTANLIPAIKNLQPTFTNIGTMLTALAPTFMTLLSVFNQVKDVILKVVLTAFSALLPVIVNIANFISSLLVPAIKFIAPYITEAAKTVGAFAAEIGVQVIPLIQQLGGTINGMLAVVKAVWIAVWPTLGPILQGVWDIIVGIIKIAWALISGIFRIALDLLSGNWGKAWTDMKNMFGGIMDGIGTIARGAWTLLTGIFTAGKNAIGAIFSALGSLVNSIWTNIWNTITGFANKIKSAVLAAFGTIRDTAGGIFRSMVNNIIDWLNPGLNAMSNFLNFFINGINKVSQFFIKKDLLGTVNLGSIGHLAHGTPDWRGGLAVVGEEGPELVSLPKHAAVLPHNESEDWLAGRVKFPSFAGGVGDFLGNIFSWITGGVGSIASNVLKNVFGGAPSLGVFSDIAGSLLGTVAGWLGQWMKDHIAALLPAPGTGGAGVLPMQQQGNFILPPNLGFPGYPGHHGMDFQFGQGTPIHEVVGGVVSPHTGWYSFGGEIDVLIDRIAGMWERYLHMSQIFVGGGQRVNRGDLIGLSGGGTVASGLGRGSNGAHLHIQYDWGNYANFVPPLTVWGSLGLFKPFAKGGVINEKIMGIGATSGKGYSFGEHGMESVVPASAQERQAQALERIERLLTNDSRLTEYQITQALGRLLANGVR